MRTSTSEFVADPYILGAERGEDREKGRMRDGKDEERKNESERERERERERMGRKKTHREKGRKEGALVTRENERNFLRKKKRKKTKRKQTKRKQANFLKLAHWFE